MRMLMTKDVLTKHVRCVDNCRRRDQSISGKYRRVVWDCLNSFSSRQNAFDPEQQSVFSSLHSPVQDTNLIKNFLLQALYHKLSKVRFTTTIQKASMIATVIPGISYLRRVGVYYTQVRCIFICPNRYSQVPGLGSYSLMAP